MIMNKIFLLLVFCFKKGGSKIGGEKIEEQMLNAATPIKR